MNEAYDALRRIAAEVTGYEARRLVDSLRWQADLGVDRIKRRRIAERLARELSLGESAVAELLTAPELGRWRRIAGLRPPVDLSSPQGAAELSEAATALVGGGPLTEEAVTETLVRIVEEKTGYERAVLSLDADLEADLGIDTIKQAQIAGRLRALYAVRWDAGMRIRDYPTLRHWVRLILDGSGGRLQASSQRFCLERLLPAMDTGARSEGQALELPASLFLLTKDDLGVALALARLLEAEGARAYFMPAPSEPLPEADLPWAIVHLQSLHREESRGDAFAPAAVSECLRLFHRVGRQNLRAFLAATAMGGDFALTPETRLLASEAGGGVGGFIKTLSAECEEVQARVVDFDPGELASDPIAIARALLAELKSRARQPEAGYRSGARQLPTWKRSELDLRNAPALRLRECPVIVVTGGAGGIGAEIALDFAQRDRARLALIGRTPEPELSLEARSRIQRMREVGGEAEYFACDVTDPAQMRAVFDKVRSRWGAVEGVVHSAGVLEDQRVENKREDSFERVYSVKAAGMRALEEATLEEPLAFFAVFGSVSGRFGNPGQCDYAAANEAVCKRLAALQARRPGLRALAVSWGAWDGTGMAARTGVAEMLKAAGQGAIEVDEGVAAFRTELFYGLAPEVVIRAAPGSLEETEHHFDPSRDAWLQDHRILGQAVVPATIGIELMVQAAQALFPERRFARLERFRIHRALQVPEGEGLRVRIEARAFAGTRPGDREVHVRLIERVVCYEARVLLGADSGGQLQAEPGSHPVERPRRSGIPAEELYPGRIPLGPAFHVLESFDPGSGEGWVRETPLQALANGPYLLAREAAFHAAALLGADPSGAALIPRSIGSLRAITDASVPPPPWRVQARKLAGAEHRFDLMVATPGGRVFCEIRDFEAIDLKQVGGLST